MKKIGIIGAMEVEVNFLRNLMGDSAKKTESGSIIFEEGKIHGVDVVLSRSGVGKVNAALCAQRLAIQFVCTNIINTGIAGGMAHGLGVMDFVVSTDAVYHDMDATGFGYKLGQIPQMKIFSFEADKNMIDAAKKAFVASELVPRPANQHKPCSEHPDVHQQPQQIPKEAAHTKKISQHGAQEHTACQESHISHDGTKT